MFGLFKCIRSMCGQGEKKKKDEENKENNNKIGAWTEEEWIAWYEDEAYQATCVKQWSMTQ